MAFKLIILLVFGFHLNVLAQLKGTLTYKQTINDKNLSSGPYNLDYVIYFNNERSIEFPVVKPISKGYNVVEVDENRSSIFMNSGKSSFIYKNFKMNELYFSDFIYPLKRLLITDTLANFNWKITSEKADVLGYACIKATTIFRGRSYVAWFTRQIDVKNGPWKFCGLPGLVVKVSDTDNTFKYELNAVNLKADFDSSILQIPNDFANQERISHESFMKVYLKMLADDEIKNREVSYDIYGTSSSKITHAEKKEKF